MSTTLTTPTAQARRGTLLPTRVAAGVIGAAQVAGALNFLVINADQATWLGPWIDVPVTALLLTGVALKLTVAVWPRLAPSLRVRLALVAVVIGVATTIVKITSYDEPEAAAFLLADAVLLTFALIARRQSRRAG